MKKMCKFLVLALAVSFTGCQSEEVFEDNASNIEVQEPAEGTFRVYPKEMGTTRSSNLVYIDLEPDNRKVYYNLQSSTYTTQQIKANYKIEFFSAFTFEILSRAFDEIENYSVLDIPRDLYFIHYSQSVYYHDGPKGKYIVREDSSSKWNLEVYNITNFDEYETNLYSVFKIPIRIKLTHKWGGPSFTYDIMQTFTYKWGSGIMTWEFDAP